MFDKSEPRRLGEEGDRLLIRHGGSMPRIDLIVELSSMSHPGIAVRWYRENLRRAARARGRDDSYVDALPVDYVGWQNSYVKSTVLRQRLKTGCWVANGDRVELVRIPVCSRATITYDARRHLTYEDALAGYRSVSSLVARERATDKARYRGLTGERRAAFLANEMRTYGYVKKGGRWVPLGPEDVEPDDDAPLPILAARRQF